MHRKQPGSNSLSSLSFIDKAVLAKQLKRNKDVFFQKRSATICPLSELCKALPVKEA